MALVDAGYVTAWLRIQGRDGMAEAVDALVERVEALEEDQANRMKGAFKLQDELTVSEARVAELTSAVQEAENMLLRLHPSKGAEPARHLLRSALAGVPVAEEETQ